MNEIVLINKLKTALLDAKYGFADIVNYPIQDITQMNLSDMAEECIIKIESVLNNIK